eukprot:CAMPEP_0117448128 /NCGR_PEP_ID=MMETSP0759-20121206/7238_1 /TAXON_ID=63605 /ORGANISM="Percolomonas cosmopolitus, Strain WS" /LENGTH=1064 /DNA_ID=CAMNT_0005240499 /DNA_START=167 /DNA_END=3361 /DNA_ORIENTATION=+
MKKKTINNKRKREEWEKGAHPSGTRNPPSTRKKSTSLSLSDDDSLNDSPQQQDDDENLKRALALSLQDSQHHQEYLELSMISEEEQMSMALQASKEEAERASFGQQLDEGEQHHMQDNDKMRSDASAAVKITAPETKENQDACTTPKRNQMDSVPAILALPNKTNSPGTSNNSRRFTQQTTLHASLQSARSAPFVPPRSTSPPMRDIHTEFIGLRNMGNTCALNTLIQFMEFSPLREYILDHIWEDNKDPLLWLFGRTHAKADDTIHTTTCATVEANSINVDSAVLQPRSDQNPHTTTTSSSPGTSRASNTQHPNFLTQLRLLFLEMLLAPFPSIEPGSVIQNIPNRKSGTQEDLVEMWESIRDVLEKQLAEESDKCGSRFKNLLYGESQEFQRDSPDARTTDEFQVLRLPINETTHSIHDCLNVIAHPTFTDPTPPESEKRSDTTHERFLFFSKLPSVLMLQMHRVRFDKTQNGVTKTTRRLSYPTTLHLDQFHIENKDLVMEIDKQHSELKAQIAVLDKRLELVNNFEGNGRIQSSLKHIIKYASTFKTGFSETTPRELKQELERIQQQESVLIKQRTDLTNRMSMHSDIIPKEQEYHLHAVFMHSGGANHGHYWVYVRNCKPAERVIDPLRNPGQPPMSSHEWIRLNDSVATGVSEAEVLAPDGDCYLLVYIRRDLLRCAKSLEESVDIPSDVRKMYEEYMQEQQQVLDVRQQCQRPGHSETSAVIEISDSDDDGEEQMISWITQTSVPPPQASQKEKLELFISEFSHLEKRFKEEASSDNWFNAISALQFPVFLLKRDEINLFHFELMNSLCKRIFGHALTSDSRQEFRELQDYLPDSAHLDAIDAQKDFIQREEMLFKKYQKAQCIITLALGNLARNLTSHAAIQLCKAQAIEAELPKAMRSSMIGFLLDLSVMDLMMRAREARQLSAYEIRILHEVVFFTTMGKRLAMHAYLFRTIQQLKKKYKDNRKGEIEFLDSLLHQECRRPQGWNSDDCLLGIQQIILARHKTFREACDTLGSRGVEIHLFCMSRFENQVPESFWTAKNQQLLKEITAKRADMR